MNTQTEKTVSLILISFLGLFLELVFIRWLPANVLSLAYFSNIVLISSFFGLGLGCIIASRVRDLFKWFPVALLGGVSLIICLRWFEVIVPVQGSEWIWSYYSGNSLNPSRFQIGILPALAVVYFINTGLFTLIGQKVGLLLREFNPLKAYSLDLIGSILGIAAFGMFSFASGSLSSPITWFVLSGGLSLWFLRKDRLQIIVGAACTLVLALMINFSSNGEIWSPYYSIQVDEHEDRSFSLFVNKFFHQQAINFDLSLEAKNKYGIPYNFKKPEKVLILGAGTGNDVAVAAMNGVSEIHAVEIDPIIADLGKRAHPNKPYQNPGVTVFIDDARSFLKRSNEKYDMVILGTLDSHALLSAMSTVRLDNFVYTIESLEDIKRHLNDKGVAVLMFSVPSPWLGERLIKMVSSVFEDPRPLAYVGDPKLFNLMMIAGPGVEEIQSNPAVKKLGLKQLPYIPLEDNYPTDNWPYLYLVSNTIPGHYLKAILLLLVLSAAAVLLMIKNTTFGFNSLNFFSLGAAFLLLETKSITTLSLLFGSTWLVNAFVFGGILAMILLANLLVSRVNIRRIGVIYVLLGATLLLNYLLPVGYFLGNDFWSRSILSSFFVALPIFFAAIIFSYHFKSVTGINSIYGINLMGAVLGGFLEYSSMITGLNALYLFAGVLYLVSYISFRKS